MVLFGNIQKRMKTGRHHFGAISVELNVGRLMALRERSGAYVVVSAFSGFSTADGGRDWDSNPMEVQATTPSIIQGQVEVPYVSILILDDLL